MSRSRRIVALALVVSCAVLGATAFVWHRLSTDLTAAEAPPSAAPPAPANALAGLLLDVSALRDIQGNQRSLASLAGDRATVLVFLGVECPLANLYVPHLIELEKDYRDKGVHFVAVYSHENESLTTAAAHAIEREIPWTVVKDFGQRLADSVGVTRTPTVCVLDSAGGLQYRGRISDQYGVNFRRTAPLRKDLQISIDELLAGKMQSLPTTDADGCLLDRERTKRAAAAPAYPEVAAIIAKRCATCHREGQSAPFALDGYDSVVQWSKMIREVVSERRMPPWHADPRYGHFANDRSLTQEEIDTLVAWIDGGMPRAEAHEEVTSPATASTAEWSIGTPDAIIRMDDPFQVPATGVLSYDYLNVSKSVTEKLFEQDRWIQAAELKPSDPSVVHHMTLAIVPPNAKADPTNPTPLPTLAAWAPGDPYFRYPHGTAVRIPQGSMLMFEVHHVPNGTPSENRPSVAFSFADSPPEHEVRLATNDHLSLKLAPGDPHYRAETQSTFAVDARILGLYPHAHFRGKAFRFEATYPDGSREILLNVPRFDFNWQTFYWLREPKRMPAGTKLTCVCHYDNSRYNLNNPNPAVEVHTGSQSTDEMMVGWVFFVTDEPQPNATVNELLIPDRSPQVKLLEDDLRADVSANTEDLKARLKLAHALYAREQWEAARAEIEEILRRDPRHAVAIHSLGRIAEKEQDDATAIEHFQAALALAPQHADWHHDLGLALVRLERYDDAVASYERALTLAHDDALLHNDLAFAYLKQDRALAADVQARAALAIEPSLAAAHANLGLALVEQERFEEALAELRQSLALKPGNADVHFHLAQCLATVGQHAEAVVEFHRALELRPDENGAASHLAWLLATSSDAAIRDGAEAVRLAELAQEQSAQEDAGVLDTLAAAYAEAERYDDAVRTMRRVIDIAGESVDDATREGIHQRLRLYESKQPYREPADP